MAIMPLRGQDDGCNRTKVAVSVTIVPGDSIYIFLENDFGPHPQSEWNGFATQMLVRILSEYEPEITFFPLDEGGGDYHYHFKTDMNLNATGKGDDVQTVYWIVSRLIGNSNCIPNRSWVLDAYDAKAPDLEQTMKNVVAQFSPIDRNIFKYELDHPSPPRDPELTIQIEKDFISPVDLESRTTKVNASVYNCRGNQVCDTHGHGQPAYYQDNIDRLDLTLGQCEGGYHIGNFMVIITNKQCKNEGKYKLEKGVEAEKKTIRIKTCQLGGGSYVETEKELIIRGLEVKVKPDRKEIYQEEQTNIILSLNETDPGGDKEPVPGKRLKVRVEGLLDGEITPKSNYVTDSRGEVRLNYKAGNKDEKIMVNASFQPEDYPDKAEGKGSVLVKPHEYDATITIEKEIRKEVYTEVSDDSHDGNCETHTEDLYRLDNNTIASLYIQLKLSHVADMPIFNQRWEYYTPISVNISDFSIQYDEYHRLYGTFSGTGCSNGGYETVVTTDQRIDRQKIYEPLSNPWIVAFDNKTGKAVKIMPGGYSIDFDLNITENMRSRQWGEKRDESSSIDQKKAEHLSFDVGPVEDPAPVPTARPNLEGIYDYLRQEVGDSLMAAMPALPIPPPSTEEVPEIKPDLLVQFGDGEGSFGGYGEKRIDEPKENGYEREQRNYNWHMVRRKKQN